MSVTRRGLAAGWVAALTVLCLLGARSEPAGSSLAAARSGPDGLRTRRENPAEIARIEKGLLPPVGIAGQTVPVMSIAEQMRRDKVPGVSVAFFENREVVWARGYGYADLEKKTPVTAETLFQAASISKPVAALAAMHLVELGSLSLDEDVNGKLISWKVPENEFTKTEKVTLRRLVTHSAGLTVHGFPGYAAGETVPTVVQVLNGEKPANTGAVRVDTEPGKMWRYSGGGFTVMQLLMTEVTGKTFPTLMSELVLRPAGMTNSTYQQPLPTDRQSLAATPYRDGVEIVKGGPHTYPEMAAAGLWTTPSDLGRMAIEVEKEYEGASNKILSQETAKEFLTRQKGDWGLGVSVLGEGQTLQFTHGGANEGYRCVFVDFPARHQGAAVMTNADSGGAIASAILRAMAREYGWPDYQVKEKAVVQVAPTVLQSYTGEYSQEQIGKISVTAKDGKLYLHSAPLGAEAIELYAESATHFFSLAEAIEFQFDARKGHKADGMVVIFGKQEFSAKRTK
jgi:CubicO group peptidase (beta-lactamase class C family)